MNIPMVKITATFEDLKDRHLGMIGTPERDAYEEEVREAIQTYQIGEAIKLARKEYDTGPTHRTHGCEEGSAQQVRGAMMKVRARESFLSEKLAPIR